MVEDEILRGGAVGGRGKECRKGGAAGVIVAVPVGAREACAEIKELADETICLSTPEFFQAVGQYYEDFSQTSDAEVRELLARAAEPGVIESEQEQA